MATLTHRVHLLGRLAHLVALVALLFACSCASARTPAKADTPPRAADSKSSGTVGLTDRVITLDGGIASSMIKKAQEKVLELDQQSHAPIWVLINSGGGSVEAGLVLIDTMRAVDSPFHCVVESKAYSMAAIILTFCDVRMALEHATIMRHEASYGTAGEDPSNRSRLDFLTRYLDGLHVEIAQRLKMPVDKYRAKIRDAWWLLAPEAYKVGVVHRVVQRIERSKPAVERTEEKTTVTTQVTTHDVPAELLDHGISKRK